tara:strand:+ start:584 stop:1000 length:417 start_codon:yes stop_codon:yes gene_type:complete
MGLDQYQVTDAYWNTVYRNPNTNKVTENTTVYPESFRTDAQLKITQTLTKDFYSSTWFRALNDIQQSEEFMSLLETTYWELKYKFIQDGGGSRERVAPTTSEIVYTFDMGSIIPKSYFLEVRFNFRTDDIHLGIGQHL